MSHELTLILIAASKTMQMTDSFHYSAKQSIYILLSLEIMQTDVDQRSVAISLLLINSLLILHFFHSNSFILPTMHIYSFQIHWNSVSSKYIF